MGNLGRVLMASGLALGEIRQQDQDRSSPDASGGSFQHLPTPIPRTQVYYFSSAPGHSEPPTHIIPVGNM